jgi:hypothetical protein
LQVFKLVGIATVIKLKQLENVFNNDVQLFCAEFIFTLIKELQLEKVPFKLVIT